MADLNKGIFFLVTTIQSQEALTANMVVKLNDSTTLLSHFITNKRRNKFLIKITKSGSRENVKLLKAAAERM